jgi:hypothetical protein
MLLGDKRLTRKECKLDGEIASGFLESILLNNFIEITTHTSCMLEELNANKLCIHGWHVSTTLVTSICGSCKDFKSM